MIGMARCTFNEVCRWAPRLAARRRSKWRPKAIWLCQPKRDGRLRQTAQYLATMLPSSFLLCLELGKALDVETA
jgi:hypothetical protein